MKLIFGPKGELIITIWCTRHRRAVITDTEYPVLIPFPVALALAAGMVSAPLNDWDGGWVVDLESQGLFCQALVAADVADECRDDWSVRAEVR